MRQESPVIPIPQLRGRDEYGRKFMQQPLASRTRLACLTEGTSSKTSIGLRSSLVLRVTAADLFQNQNGWGTGAALDAGASVSFVASPLFFNLETQ